MSQPYKETFLKDYTPPPYQITEIHLSFDIHAKHTLVKNRALFSPNPQVPAVDKLSLNGEHLELMEVRLDGRKLDTKEYQITEEHLIFEPPQRDFTLETFVRIYPQKNKTLEGLYSSRALLCTQNEPEGFRKITYHLDRPDVMSAYTTVIEASKEKYPVLLSNGNMLSQEDLGERQRVTWKDPFKKPSYLFALVAGDLIKTEDTFTTCSGKRVPLHIYTDKGNEHRTRHALDSLKRAMRWDEETFGLEYDLDLFMIVAVDDFNFGAMENKGLNIFNASAVLAAPDSTTDENYDFIEGVIAHEYFHNWTGNRVTCRDWFQITLKEGLTVFRDQQYTADQVGRYVKRIADVSSLRDFQFPEDAGPNAHAIRPPSYIQINNFYTYTIYEKGAEIIRMVYTLIGEKAFKEGILKYFELYDAQAVTTEDFIHAMEIVSNRDLTQFKKWYRQIGTPSVKIEEDYQKSENRYRLKVSQSLPSLPTNEELGPLHIPLQLGLLDQSGKDLPIESLLEITQAQQSFTFENVSSKPVPSLFRNFSSPVKIDASLKIDDYLFLFEYDKDAFNRYEAGQRVLLSSMEKHYKDPTPVAALDPRLVGIYKKLLADEDLDGALKATLFSIPSLITLASHLQDWNYKKIYATREAFIIAIAEQIQAVLLEAYEKNKERVYSRKRKSISARKLKNVSLSYLSRLSSYDQLIFEQYTQADNMTDTLSSLKLLCQKVSDKRDQALAQFYQKWENDPLVMNKYFMVQANAVHGDVLEDVKRLENDPQFDKQNPNKIRSLYGIYARNLPVFHNGGAEGYAFIAEKIIEIDSFNPMAASGLCSAFNDYPKLEKSLQILMKAQLKRVLDKKLSPHAYEIIHKIYKAERD